MKRRKRGTYHWPGTRHEFLNFLSLVSLNHGEIAKLLIIFCGQVEGEVVEVENLFLFSLNCQFLFFLFMI